jgi:hypothetical protein
MSTLLPAAARTVALAAALCCPTLWTATCLAQFPQPRLRALHPPGGKQGTTVEVTAVGTDLDELQKLHFFHPGIVATPVMTEPTEFDPQPRPVPGRVKVTIAAGVPSGPYDVVAVGRFGVSNPRIFMVGSREEAAKQPGNDSPQKAQQVPTDVTISGVAAANVADHYAITLAAGQRVHVEAWARRIDSRLTASLAILDPSGTVVAKSQRVAEEDPSLDFTARVAGPHVVRIHDMYMGGGEELGYRLSISTGPVVESVFPPAAVAGGTVKLTAIGRGLPNAAPAAIPGAAADLQQVSVDAQLGDAARGASARLTWRLLAASDSDPDLVDAFGGLLDTMPVPPAVLSSPTPVVVEQEPNDDPAKPQRVTLPATIAGRFVPRGDRDWIVFDAKAGEPVVFDLHSRRLGLPTDVSLLVESLTPGPDGKPVAKELAFADDGGVEFQTPLFDRGALDPVLSFTPPADGTYRVMLRDLGADSQAGTENMWVLEIRRPEPSFQLLALLAQADRADAKKTVQMTPSIPAGGTAAVDVLVIRRDGFTGDVTLEAEGLPAGVTAQPAIVPGKANRGVLVLTAADGTQPTSGGFRVVGKGRHQESDLVQTARVASLSWNVTDQNQPYVIREVHEIPLAVTADVAPLTVAPQETKTWEVQRGGKLSVPLSVIRRAGAKGGLSLTAAGLPAEIKVAELKLDDKATTAAVSINVDQKLAAGTQTILLRGMTKCAFARNPQAAQRAKEDAERLAALTKDRAAKLEAAKQALAAADKKLADAKAAGQPPPADLEAGRKAAAEAVQAAEAAVKAATAEKAKREEAAKAAATASAAKDIDVPVLVPPIVIAVKDPPPAEKPKP